MASRFSSESLASASAQAPWITVAIWLVVLVAFMAISATLFSDALTSEFKILNNADSV